jgi:hypothetical protein
MALNNAVLWTLSHCRLLSMVNDFIPLRIEIRRWEKPSRPYTWEIWASETKCVERGSYEYPTRGSPPKAARRALLRITLMAAHSPGGVFGWK